jgi:hypothetical protein
MRKFRRLDADHKRLDLIKILHDCFWHARVSRTPPPQPQARQQHAAPTLIGRPPQQSTSPHPSTVPISDESDEVPLMIDESPAEVGEKEICVVCMENPRTSICVPCGHVCMCAGCAEVLMQGNGICPLCRVKITKITKLKQTELNRVFARHNGSVYTDPENGNVKIFSSCFENRENPVTCTNDLQELLRRLRGGA